MNLALYIANIISKEPSKGITKMIVNICTLAVALGVAVMIITTSLVNGFQKEISNKIFELWGQVLISKYTDNKSFENEPFQMDEKLMNTIAKEPYTKHIQATAIKAGILKTSDAFDGVVLKGIDHNFNYDFLERNIIKTNDSNWKINEKDSAISKNIIISQKTASRLGLKVGMPCMVYIIDRNIRVRKLVVSAIYNTGLEDFDKMYAWVDIGLIQKLNSWKPNEIGTYEVFIKDIKNINSNTETINSLLPMNLYAASIKELKPQIFDWLALQNLNEWIIIAVMLSVTIINIITTLLIMILERTNMIGIFKAMGAANSLIRRIFLIITSKILIKGLLLGNALGMGLCLIQKYTHLIKLPEDTYFIDTLPVSFNFFEIGIINFGTIIICLICLTIPTFIISKISPIQSIKFD